MPSRRRVAALAAAAALAGGCAGIPTAGGVHVGRVLPPAGEADQVDVRIVPKGPVAGMSPADVIRGFLRSMVDSDSDYEIARSYLTPRAATSWRATTVTTYDDSNVRFVSVSHSGGAQAVDVLAPRLGVIDARGDYTTSSGLLQVPLVLVRQAGEWRIDKLPSGALLSSLDAQRAFRLTNIYYLDRSGTALVPEQVLLRPELPGMTTAVVQALIGGPGPWLAPAVRTAFPAGTEVIGNVPVDSNGVAEVNLSSAVRQVSAPQLRAMSAQLVWTLRQLPTVNAVRLLADGSPLIVPGAPAVQPRDAWPHLDPTLPPGERVAVYDAGSAVRAVGRAVAGLSAVGALHAPVLSRDGALIAGLRDVGRRVELAVGRLGARPPARVSGLSMTAPTFDETGDAFSVVTDAVGRHVVEVLRAGGVRTVDASATLLRHPVLAMRLSRDGARVAAVIGPAGAAQLFVGRVSQTPTGLRLDGFRPVLPSASDVRGVAWTWSQGVEQVVVTARGEAAGRQVIMTDPDGYQGDPARPVDVAGLRGAPVDVTAAGSSLVVEAAGAIWQHAVAGWRRVGAGTAPAFPD